MSNRWRRVLVPVLAAALLAAACTGPHPSSAEAGARPSAREVRPASPPRTLRATGLYSDWETEALAAGVLSFAPQYPLWTDGAAKRRFIALPPGASIDASDPGAWQFPVGTRLWKEFSFGRRVETRYMELGPGGWIYATYVFREDGSDADLADARGMELAIEGGSGTHSVPSATDCIACHGNAPTPVLGFSLLQLSPDRDPLAPHAAPPAPDDVDLPALVARDVLHGLPATFLDTPPRIAARTPIERAALGYLHGNCGGCHREDGPLARLGMRLAHPEGPSGAGDEPALATTVGAPSSFALPSDPRSHAVRVLPGDPAASVLLARMSSRDPFTQMPPLGTHVVDEEAVRLVSAWIAELAPAPVD